MGITAKKGTVKEGGENKEAFTVTFTNGAKEQLEQLQKFLKTDEPLDVIKVGISFIQKLKEQSESKRDKTNEPKKG